MFYVIISADCENKDGQVKNLKAYFAFEDENHCMEESDCGFDGLIGPFNNWLKENNYDGWSVTDVLELYSKTTKEKSINPIVVLN